MQRHISKDCKKRMICQECSQKHRGIFHVQKDSVTFTRTEDSKTEKKNLLNALVSLMQETCGCTGAGEYVLAIVLVKVKSIKSEKVVEIYAFMDQGSQRWQIINSVGDNSVSL